MYSRILLLLMLFIGTFTSAIAEEQGDSPSFLKGLTDKVTTSLKENVTGLSLKERAQAMIAVAHPDFRAELQEYADKTLC